jgi:peptide methionine sulfoxide reductase msrA/msrB
VYNPEIITYATLVELFWTQIDPTDAGGQFTDRGYHYTTAIFYRNEEEKLLAEASKKTLEDSGKFETPIVTLILPATPFYDAESYHQDYYKKSALRYNLYKK